MSRRQVLVVHDTLAGWGSEKNLANIGEFAPAADFAVSYLVTAAPPPAAGGSGDAPPVAFLSPPRLRVNRYTQPLNFAVKLLRALAWLRRRRDRFDFVIVSNPEESIVAFLARKLLCLRAKLVVYLQIPIAPATQNIFLRWALEAQLAIMRRCDGVLCLSPGLRDGLAADARVKTRTWVLPSCIDPTRVAALAAEAVDEGWLADDGRKTLLWVGRLSNGQKRVDVLLAAIAHLRQQHGDAAFEAVLVGDGEDRGSLEALARTLGIADQVHFVGYRSNPYPYYRLADLFVLSSDVEGFGNVIVEAMACGVPVIATDCRTGPADILGGGRWGVLVPPGDHLALAGEILRVLTDDALRAELRQRSLARARDFHCSQVFAGLAAVCDEIEAGAARPGDA